MEIVLKVMIFIFSLIGLFMYIIIAGGSMYLTNEEKRIEDEEQIKYLKENKNDSKRRIFKWKKNC